MKLKQRCRLNGQVYEMDLPITEHDFAVGMAKYRNGELIQRAFPTLNADCREFILTGTPPEVWDKLMGSDE
jgi:hypothetical protein